MTGRVGRAWFAKRPDKGGTAMPAFTECCGRPDWWRATFTLISCFKTDWAMARARKTPDDGLSKFQRYRKAQHARGMKLLRVWVPDPQRPGFAQEAERQAALLRGRLEESEALAFIEAAFEWPEP